MQSKRQTQAEHFSPRRRATHRNGGAGEATGRLRTALRLLTRAGVFFLSFGFAEQFTTEDIF